MNDERFRLLVEAYLEGGLSADQARELGDALPEFRARLLDEVLLAGLLSRAFGKAPADLGAKILAGLRPPQAKEEMLRSVLDQLPPGRPASRRRGLFWILAAAAATLAIVWALAWSGGGGRRAAEGIGRAGEPPPGPRAGSAPAEAVARAVAYLKRAPLPSCRWQAPLPADELVLLALQAAGESPSDPFFRTLLERVTTARLRRVYSVSLQAALLERMDPAQHRPRIAECAQFLVDNLCANGQWSYGEEGPPLAPGREVRPTRSGPATGNNSCSQMAALGLLACARAGIDLPPETLRRAREGWIRTERPDREGDALGWCYTREEHPHRAYGSMTAGAVASLLVYDRLLGEPWQKDPAVRGGLSWLTKYYSVTENIGPVEELMAKELISDSPDPKTEYYYYMWALERTGALSGLETLGTHGWYSEGLQEVLLSQRPDGSWYAGVPRCQPVYDTCFAILFLTRSTRPF